MATEAAITSKGHEEKARHRCFGSEAVNITTPRRRPGHNPTSGDSEMAGERQQPHGNNAVREGEVVNVLPSNNSESIKGPVALTQSFS